MRADGKKIKNADPMYKVAAFVMKHRMDAMNMITVDIPYDPMHEYVKAKRAEGIIISHMALVIAAYLRAAAEFPALNRFVVNKRIYARNEFCVGLVVLKSGDSGHGIMSKVYFDMEDTIFDVQRKIDEYISKNRQTEENNSTEDLIDNLLSVPGLVNVGVGTFKMLDKYGLLPKKVIDASPFHASLLISNLASIRTNHIYHHVYEFGTTSVACTIGNLRVTPKLKGEQVVFERTLPLGVVMDERICSGAYFAAVFKKVSTYLKNPTLLEVPPEKVIRDEV